MNFNEMILNALAFIIMARDEATLRIDEILDLDNDLEDFAEIARNFDFNLESFNAARRMYIQIKG